MAQNPYVDKLTDLLVSIFMEPEWKSKLTEATRQIIRVLLQEARGFTPGESRFKE